MDEIVNLDQRFLTLAAEIAALASGSSGVQGAWPKVLLTQGIDSRWYPDPMVADRDATDHIIVKWVGDKEPSTRIILAAEARYLELAREWPPLWSVVDPSRQGARDAAFRPTC
jgi:serine/threonine-protein kinase HipA